MGLTTLLTNNMPVEMKIKKQSKTVAILLIMDVTKLN